MSKILPKNTKYLDMLLRGIKIVKEEESGRKREIPLVESSFSRLDDFSPQGWVDNASVCVYGLIKDGSYKEIYSSFNKRIKFLSLSSSKQIKRFIEDSLSAFRPSDFTFHFLFKDKKSKLFVAYTKFSEDGCLFIEITPVSFDDLKQKDNILFASEDHRFIIFQEK